MNTNIGDDTVNLRPSVPKPMLPCRKLPEIPAGPWSGLVEESEYNATSRSTVDSEIKLVNGTISAGARIEWL